MGGGDQRESRARRLRVYSGPARLRVLVELTFGIFDHLSRERDACGREAGKTAGIARLCQKRHKFVSELGTLYLALPSSEDFPTLGVKQSLVELIALSIPRNFRNPVITIGLWSSASSCTVMPMPKAPVNEDDLPESRENEVGRAR